MKKKRHGGIATLIVVFILIFIVLACLPSLKAITNANVESADYIRTDIINITK